MSRNHWYDEDDSTGCLVIVLCIIAIIALLFLEPLCIMWLWNWLAVGLFGLPVLGFWESFGLMLLCHFLFGHTTTVRSKS